ncbi:hypothetical protein KTT_16100 [Tengunoibacter tsumagoiensis]|uniref:Uncharacterized protein n=1 Tax=Tengunoibacter tsumagoiensis TaxID=2014871 RepID=A0A401ZY29_9CHLR|nr:hypothetical protein KTT_16100 [Tengunoibacter tsumagoiensis]
MVVAIGQGADTAEGINGKACLPQWAGLGDRLQVAQRVIAIGGGIPIGILLGGNGAIAVIGVGQPFVGLLIDGREQVAIGVIRIVRAMALWIGLGERVVGVVARSAIAKVRRGTNGGIGAARVGITDRDLGEIILAIG